VTMPRRALGASGIEVSALCLGSMTWGSQNTAAEAASQIDLAIERGVNFLDTAEMYPTTPRTPQTHGDTERVIGAWLERSGRRGDLVLATKVNGNGHQPDDDITGAKLRASLEGSLRRLGTDHVDLYQLHWPNRGSYHFRKQWSYDPTAQRGPYSREHVRGNVVDVLETCDALVREGKIRAVGLSNETAWGVMQFVELARTRGLPRVASVQNEYSLLCRLFDTDLAEIAHHEGVGLLAFSPLAAGILSDKYAGGAPPPAGSRRALNDTLNGRWTPHSERASARYAALAREHGLEPVQLALAFCLTRPFTTSVIIGATDLRQLEANLSAADIGLDETTLAAIEAIRREHPMPM